MALDTKAMNRLLAAIEKEGAKYGMKLNKGKCELMHTDGHPNVHFADGQKVPAKEEVKYLGCHLNRHCDTTKEIKTRTAACMSTLNKLHQFWRHSDCPTKFKIIALDAVIKSKLLYGMETAQLTQGAIQRLDVLQLKGLRTILKMTTTYVDRNNDNQTVFEKANRAIETEGSNMEIKPYSKVYKERKINLYNGLLNRPQEDPLKQITFSQDSLQPVGLGRKRVGRPRLSWTAETAKDIWEALRNDLPHNLKRAEPDLKKKSHQNLITQQARSSRNNNDKPTKEKNTTTPVSVYHHNVIRRGRLIPFG